MTIASEHDAAVTDRREVWDSRLGPRQLHQRLHEIYAHLLSMDESTATWGLAWESVEHELADSRRTEEARLANPWDGRAGWDREDEIPIITYVRHRKGEEPKEVFEEPGYAIYNELVRAKHHRPFRTAYGEPRLAIPTTHGLEIWDPTTKEGGPSSKLISAIGYSHYTLKGKAVPGRDIACAVGALTGRALSRDLPAERVVDLCLRFAPGEKYGGRIDMADSLRRCILVGPDGWSLADVGYPVFDFKPHMRALPPPAPSEDPKVGWKRVEAWWRFVPIAKGEDGHDPRLLALADQVQQVIAPGTAMTVKALSADEGTGKTTIAGFYQALLDPSSSGVVKPPAEDDGLVNLAMNHATVNLDNLSSINQELSDDLCRLSTGIGLTKRKLWSDAEEISLNVTRSVILNGIKPAPRAADLLRRVLFLPLEPPIPQIGKVQLEEEWIEAHPDILGGILDLCVLTARVLRDSPPPSYSTSMADYVRIGQAVAVAMGRDHLDFVTAWERNIDAQGLAAAEDPWVTTLRDFFEQRPLTDPAVSADEIAQYINRVKPGLFGRAPVNPIQAGIALARVRKTLKRLGVQIRSKMVRGVSVYFRYIPEGESAETPPQPPSPPPSAPNQGGGSLNLHPTSTLTSTPDSLSSGEGQGGGGVGQSALGGELAKEGVADPGDLFGEGVTRADRARAAVVPTADRLTSPALPLDACSRCVECVHSSTSPEECRCVRCSPWGHSTTATGLFPHFCGSAHELRP